MENRYINIKITDNSGKVSKKAKENISGIGKQSKKTAVVGSASMATLSTGLKGVGLAAATATSGIKAMTLALISSGVGAVVVALGALTAGFISVVSSSKEFAVSQSNLKAVLQGTDQEMQALNESAQELGKTTVFTATQVTEMQLELGKLGFTTVEILDATAGALDLAAASGTNLGEAAEVAASTLNGFGLDAEETNRIVDVMAMSFTSSALNMEKFRESMKLVAPIAKTTNTSLEDSAAALSILADRGVAGSRAGTQLRRVMSDLALKTGKDFQGSLELTAEKLANASSNADKLSIAKELVGDRAKGSLIALAENREELFALADQYRNSEGAAKDMAAIRLDNLTGDTTLLKSAMQGLMLSIEDGQGVFAKLARGAVQLLTKAITAMTAASEYLGFAFPDMWEGMKMSAEATSTFLGGVFDKLGAHIRLFANKALLAIADIPIIGSGIDKAKVRENIDAAVDALNQANKKLEQSSDLFDKARIHRETRAARALAAMKQLELDRENKIKLEKIQEFEEAATEEATKAEADRQRKLKALKAALRKEDEDFEADDAVKKLELKKQRKIEEVEALKLDKETEREILKQIDDVYDEQIEMAKQEKQDKDAESFANFMEGQFKVLDENATKEIELQDKIKQFKLGVINAGLDAAIYAAGEESKVGKALFVLKQALAIKELIFSAKKSIKKAALTAAESTGEVSKGTAKAAATLNPFIIASYAITAAGVIASIISAFKASKSAAADAGALGSSAASANIASSGRSSQQQAPSFNLIGNATAGENKIASAIESRNKEAVRAYVVTDDIQSGIALERNINQTASIG